MSDLKTSIILDLAGNLASRAGQFRNGINRLGQDGSRSMRKLAGGVSAASRGLDRLGNRYTALLTGAAGVGTVRMLVGHEERLTRLGIQANKTAEEIGGLNSRIFEVAQEREIRVNPDQILNAIAVIVDATGDLDFAEQNLRNIGLLIRATGAEGQAIGGIMAEFQKMGITSREEVLQALDILNVQGKEGAFTLQNLAALGSRVVTAYTAMGRTGVPAIREMGAALQVIRQGTGSSEMAATAFEALLRTLGDASKVKMLQQGGIQVFDPEQAKIGKEVLRPINELMVEIIKKTGGRKTLISQVFDAEAVRAFNAASAEFQRTGQVQSLEKFYQVQADGTTTTRDSARAARTAAASLTYLHTSWKKFADEQLAGPIHDLADTLNSLEPGTVDRWLKIGGGLALTLGGLVIANKVAQAGAGLLGLLRGKKGLVAGGVAGATGAIPVWVVNGPASLWNGPGGSRLPGGVAGAAGSGAASMAGTALLPAATAGALAIGSMAVGKALAASEARATSAEGLRALRSRHMVMGGGANSYQVGLIDRELARRAGDQLMSTGQMKGELKISIDADGRPRVRELRGQNLDLDVDTGRLMLAH